MTINEQEIYENLKKLTQKELEETIEAYDYEWDENEFTSRNLRELAESMLDRES